MTRAPQVDAGSRPGQRPAAAALVAHAAVAVVVVRLQSGWRTEHLDTDRRSFPGRWRIDGDE